MTASNVKFSALINKGCFKIPEYQRPYSWEKDHVDALLESLKECTKNHIKGYFMGAVMIQKNDSNSYDIVDGQQRLITISLIAKALMDRIQNLNITTDMNKEYLFSIQRILKVKTTYRLELLDVDDRIFKKILTNEESNDYSLLTKNYAYIKDMFKSFQESEIETYAEIIDELLFIEVELDIKDDPFQIFDTMNSLGMSLSFFDLVKNNILSIDKSLAQKWQDHFDDKKDSFWRKKINIGAWLRSQSEHFFSFYIIIHCDDDKKSNMERQKKYKADLKKLTKKAINEELNKIIKYSEIYRSIIECTKNYGDEFYLLSNVMKITEQYSLVPVIFEVISNNEKNKNIILTTITNYIVRQFVCSSDTKGINKNVVSLSKDFNKLKNIKGKISPVSDDDIRLALNNDIINNKRAKNILLLIEQKCQSKGVIFNNKHISLEHISALKAIDNISEEGKLKIGNMMLLSIEDNIMAGTKEYKDKLATHYQNWAKGMKTYLLDSVSSWNEETIRCRTSSITDLIINNYPKPFND